MEKVRRAIESGLPEEMQEGTSFLRSLGVLCGQSFDALARTARAISGSLLSSAEYFSHNL